MEWTPLHYACARGHKRVAEKLIEYGASVGKIDSVYRSYFNIIFLIYAQMGSTSLHKATYYSHPECVLLLV